MRLSDAIAATQTCTVNIYIQIDVFICPHPDSANKSYQHITASRLNRQL